MPTSRPWFVNASPAIVLGKIGRLDLLEMLAGSIAVPRCVIGEIAAGAGDDPGLETTLAWVGARAVADVPLAPCVAHWDLGAGESQVLSHCFAANDCVAVLDDGEARACAHLLVFGSSGLLESCCAPASWGLFPPLVHW